MESKLKLTKEQEKVIQLVLEGRHVFFTGEAGTGKSALIEHITARLKARKRRFAVTALTGLAATLIEGQTLHHFLGLGLLDKLHP